MDTFEAFICCKPHRTWLTVHDGQLTDTFNNRIWPRCGLLIIYRQIKCAPPRVYKPCEKSLLTIQLINDYSFWKYRAIILSCTIPESHIMSLHLWKLASFVGNAGNKRYWLTTHLKFPRQMETKWSWFLIVLFNNEWLGVNYRMFTCLEYWILQIKNNQSLLNLIIEIHCTFIWQQDRRYIRQTLFPIMKFALIKEGEMRSINSRLFLKIISNFIRGRTITIILSNTEIMANTD